MKKLKLILAAAALLTSSMIATQAQAKPGYPALAPAAYSLGGVVNNQLTGGIWVNLNNTISCSTCHSGAPYTEDNVTSSFGVGFKRYSDDDNAGTILTGYNTMATFDSDGDGFSNQQESFFGSSMNNKFATPSFASGNISAKAINGGPVSEVSLQAGAATAVAPQVVLGGIAYFSSPYNTVANSTTSTDFFFKAGGAQTGATVLFYDTYGSVLPISPSNTADVGYLADPRDGRINISIKDEGAFDLYTTATFIADAITKYNTFVPSVVQDVYATISPLATINPYAKVSALATIEPYATIDAYAVIDDYAIVGAYAKIGAYAYVGASVDLYTGLDQYTQVTVDAYAQAIRNITVPTRIKVVNGAGHVAARFAVTTIPPVPLLLAQGAGGGGEAATGLHCMTSNFNTQALFFFALIMLGIMVRRKSI